jgi:hypothetical protein
MGPMALLPPLRKACCRFLLPLKIHRPRLGLNPKTLGATASKLTTRPLRTTNPCILANKLDAMGYLSVPLDQEWEELSLQ